MKTRRRRGGEGREGGKAENCYDFAEVRRVAVKGLVVVKSQTLKTDTYARVSNSTLGKLDVHSLKRF